MLGIEPTKLYQPQAPSTRRSTGKDANHPADQARLARFGLEFADGCAGDGAASAESAAAAAAAAVVEAADSFMRKRGGVFGSTSDICAMIWWPLRCRPPGKRGKSP